MGIEIKCDECRTDLTYSGGSYCHCLHLKNRKYGPKDGHIIDVYFHPIINEDKYFCDLNCLKKWLEDK